MKTQMRNLICCLFLAGAPVVGLSQPPNCGTFDISGTLYAGPTDWFGPSGLIDESAYNGIGFIGMNLPENSIVNGLIYHGALYGRDYCGTDQTAFVTSNKNGEDPNIWSVGTTTVQDKSDIIDVFAHIRRLGTTLNDPLVMYFGLAKATNNGEAFWSAELFAQCLTDYSPTFNCPGPCHTLWEFDVNGNVTTVGDLIIAIYFKNNVLESIEQRIWVTRDDFENTSPANFSFGQEFDGDGQNALTGYASITGQPFCFAPSPTGAVAPPWGSLDGQCNVITTYSAAQFTEVAIDLNDLGVSPATIPGLNGCSPPFCAILFKTRTSQSFTSELKDLAGPYDFRWPEILPATIIGDTLNCGEVSVTLSVEETVNFADYVWVNGFGDTVALTPSFSTSQPGAYVLLTDPYAGCLLTPQDTFFLLAQPCAVADTVFTAMNTSVGGNVRDNDHDLDDVLTSLVVSLVEGPSNGSIILNGDGSFTYEPATGFEGTDTVRYSLCDDTAPVPLCDEGLLVIFVQPILPVKFVDFALRSESGAVTLDWTTAEAINVLAFDVQRAGSTGGFTTIGTIDVERNETALKHYRYVDRPADTGKYFYRIMARDLDGSTTFSAVRTVSLSEVGIHPVRVYPLPASTTLYIEVRALEAVTEYSMFAVNGALVFSGKSLNQRIPLDVNGLTTGMYLLQIRTPEGMTSHKVLVGTR